MTRHRIALAVNAPGLGGVTEVVYQLLRHLPYERHDLHVFFLKGAEAHDEDRAGQLARFKELGVNIATAPEGAGKIEVIAALSTYLERHRMDLLHTHSFRPNLYGRIAGSLQRARGLRILAHYHNHYDDKWSADSAALGLERTLAASTDRMIAVSSQVRDHVTQRIGIDEARIAVVENGADLERFAPRDMNLARRALRLDPNAFTVGLIGRVCEQKGQEDLIEAAALLAPRLPHVRFVLFGDIEDRSLFRCLMARIDEAGLEDAVTFAGHVSDVPMAYAACDIIAAPSRWEGFPLVIAEAMAASKPIIATTVSAIPDMVAGGKAACLVAPRAPAELAEAIARLIDDENLRRSMAARAHALSARFSWADAAARVASIYSGLLDPQTTGKRGHDARLSYSPC